MATYRGLDGFLAVGGYVVGNANPKTKNSYTIGITTIDINASVSLYGVMVAGDKFTIAGESGSPVHTVNNATPVVATANELLGVTFTPGIATGGVAANAAVTIEANAIVNAHLWDLSTQQELIDASVFGSGWKANVGGQGSWQGRGQAFLDYGDLRQKALIDALMQSIPASSIAGMVFGVSPLNGLKQFYGSCVLNGLQVTAQVDNLVTVVFSFTGKGYVLPNWA